MFDYVKNMNQEERSCKKCTYKENNCGMWNGENKNKEFSETGWNRNRLAIHCFEFIEK